MSTPPPTNEGRKFPAEPLTRGEVNRLLAATSQRSASGIRMRALIGVMYGAGLRIAETLALEPRDIDLGSGSIRVREGKGRKARLAGIDPGSAALLSLWLGRRSDLGLKPHHKVFSTYTEGNVGGEMSPRYVRASLARAGIKAGITKRVHPHGLRHSLAFSAAQDGTPVGALQRQLGHGSLAVTSRYVNHLAATDVVEAFRNRDPWAVATTARNGVQTSDLALSSSV